MLIALEIAFTIFGLLAVIRGKMTLTKTRVVEGLPARLLGLVAMIEFPMALTAGIIYGLFKAKHGNGQMDEKELVILTGIELGFFVVMCIVVFSIGFLLAVDPTRKKKRKRRKEYNEHDEYQYEDDRPSRKPSKDSDKDDKMEAEDDRPTRNRRKARYDDHEEEPPAMRKRRSEDDEDDDGAVNRRPWQR